MSRTVILLLLVVVAYVSLSNASCPANEIMKSCSSECEPKCGQKTQVDCIEMCKGPRCQCKSGYMRNSHNKCVLPKNC
ncbi:chymotrypsin inhibitor-like [Colletes gigas]|uniref:chymotrypsin inhibitor-like n=1 Tax=Colletes gigas TaxID=935657 RepID=UPI001C9AACCC|nr:chymotrypsin inhibitor-like [Colletes gigas]